MPLIDTDVIAQGAMTKLHFEDEVYRLRGAAFEVHNTLGNGFLEAVYQECLVHEFRVNDIPFVAQKALTLSYKGGGADANLSGRLRLL